MPDEQPQQHESVEEPTAEITAQGEWVTEMDWVTPNPPIPEAYANYVNLGATIWDIAMDFGTIVGVNPTTKHLQVVRRVRVSMSPETAAALVLSLSSALKKYEDQFGKIRFPPSGDQIKMFAKTHNLSTGETSSEESLL